MIELKAYEEEFEQFVDNTGLLRPRLPILSIETPSDYHRKRAEYYYRLASWLVNYKFYKVSK